MSLDAMKQALEYTRPGAIVPVTPETVKMLVDALRIAIEQAERQEPVVMWDGKYQFEVGNLSAYKLGDHNWIPLYTAPPQRQPLTIEEIKAVIRAGEYDSMEEFARAIERAHGIGGGE